MANVMCLVVGAEGEEEAHQLIVIIPFGTWTGCRFNGVLWAGGKWEWTEVTRGCTGIL